MSGDDGLRFRVAFEDESSSTEARRAIAAAGGEVLVEEEAGLLPLAVLLAVVLPPGIALVALTLNDIVHSWKDRGTVIDARGEGDPKISASKGLPYGTIVILTRDGDEAKRSDLAPTDVGAYLASALKALAGGASASVAAKAAASAIAG